MFPLWYLTVFIPDKFVFNVALFFFIIYLYIPIDWNNYKVQVGFPKQTGDLQSVPVLSLAAVS